MTDKLDHLDTDFNQDIINQIVLWKVNRYSEIPNSKVIKITDGDTIVVLNSNNEQIKIRLEGIDCPESKQDFGTKAKQATSDLCFGKQVTIIKSGEDRYGRTLGFVFVGDLNVNKELLRQGMALHCKQQNKNEELAKM